MTSMGTLQSSYADQSWFSARVSGNFGSSFLHGEAIFIDRNPKHFGRILDFMRVGFCVLPDDILSLRELWHEVDFYSLDSMKAHIEQAEEWQNYMNRMSSWCYPEHSIWKL